jgi:hypothetical protein
MSSFARFVRFERILPAVVARPCGGRATWLVSFPLPNIAMLRRDHADDNPTASNREGTITTAEQPWRTSRG